jgi:hypothetical protein
MPRYEASQHQSDSNKEIYLSVAQQSYRGAQNSTGVRESCSPARAAQEKAQERHARAPKMAALSNYEMSFQDTSGASPSRSCRPRQDLSLVLPFTATSTSRASYTPTKEEHFAARAASPVSKATHSKKFTATSNSRYSYVDHKPKVPVLVHEHRRPLTHQKFTAISTNQATFLPPASPQPSA